MDLATRVYEKTHEHEVDGRLHWGRYFTWHKDDPVNTAVASVHSAVLSFSPIQNGRMLSVSQVAKECLKHFPEWCSRLVDWIEALTSDDLNAAHRLHAALAPEHWTSAAWIYSSDAGADYTFVNPVLRVFGRRGENAMGSTEWTVAIRAANEKRGLPEIWALIRDARAAQRRGQGRRAVLDAATAAELIIDKELRAQLTRRNGKSFAERLLKNTWQVSRRADLMTSLGMWLPTSLDTKLSSLRNRVMHSNARVAKAEASAAIGVAEELARHYAAHLLK